ncbi:aromatic acid exporter family protein [Saccharomonospora saliphila]|uniref:hypothetical protein n=1 Tax=Saccharomonospora saliphila TaxID=369829 RepID=UPI0003A1F26D|nr:hypothetical protein [Saccharomonospora saliphila]
MIVFIGLLVGQWRGLGTHGWQVPVAVMFAHQYFVVAPDWDSGWGQLAVLCGLIVLGAAVGVLVNTVIPPPLSSRSAENNVGLLSRTASELLGTMATTLRAGLPTEDRAREFEKRARELGTLAARTRDSVDVAVEKRSLNPRRLLGRSVSFEGHYCTVDGLTRLIDDVRSVARTLDTASEHFERTNTAQRRWLESYGGLLDLVADATRSLGELGSVTDVRDNDQLADTMARAWRRRDALDGTYVHGEVGEPGPWPTVRALSTDAYRLVDDLAACRTRLVELADQRDR